MAISIKDIFFAPDDDAPVEEKNVSNKKYVPNKSGAVNQTVLIQPRAFSESQQIADHLKADRPVIVNMKRITTDQAKRIVDFLSGTVYAIGGQLSRVGSGIFLCTPCSMSVEGSIEEYGSKEKVEDDIDLDF